MVGARTNDMVTADELANELQFLLKTKWTMDEDTYNLDAFDQCEGAWPIAHPLPLPLWSNDNKKPFVVDSVRTFLPILIPQRFEIEIYNVYFSSSPAGMAI